MLSAVLAFAFALSLIMMVRGILKADSSQKIDFTPGRFREMTPSEKKARNEKLWTDILESSGLDRAAILVGAIGAVGFAVGLVVVSL